MALPASKRRLIASVIGIAAIGLGVMLFMKSRGTEEVPDTDGLLRRAKQEYVAGGYAVAEELAKQVLSIEEDSPAALIVAAESATKQQRLDQALEYYSRVPEDGTPESISALYGGGEILIHQGRFSAGEKRLRRVLRRDPDHKLANYRLTYVLGITGRSWEAVSYGIRLIQSNVFSVAHLLMLGDAERAAKGGPLLERCRKTVPDDPLPRLGLARIAMVDNRLDEAEQHVRAVLKSRPEQLEAHARLLEILLQTGRTAEFLRQHQRLPQSANTSPEIWIVRGLWCRERKDRSGAIRCFHEALLLAPSSRRGCYQLGQSLQSMGQPDAAAPFLKRAERLQKLSTVFDNFYWSWTSRKIDLNALQTIVSLNESLGHVWEAWAWSQVALQHAPQANWARVKAQRLQRQLHRNLPRTVASFNPALRFKTTDYPLPDWAGMRLAGKTRGKQDAAGNARIAFRDRATEAGLRFTYFNSADPTTPGARILETTGGGVAALDYDADGWPDLVFTQGAPWPKSSKPHSYRDRLFRNRGDGQFIDVTAESGFGDADFSQGVSVGDLDNDGFPDLYIANLGRNRFYHNNGDGTYSEITIAVGKQPPDWTTSCLIADLNGDGLPDLYDVNYISDKELSQICKRDGKPISCSPLAFLPAHDRLLLNRGDGQFEDVTERSGIKANNGYGLGIVAADFGQTGLLSLLVANDQTANFFFENRTSAGKSVAFREGGLAAGLAVDAEGKSQGSMGIAAGDANGDGLMDLFVTNYYNESNALYRGQKGQLFTEESHRFGLRSPSFKMVGFGTQFLDADLDGWPDLVVANGHLDDLTSLGEAYEMRPQLFRNQGAGRFSEMTSSLPGSYFQQKRLGRGLARVDWNRDGRDDFVVSHLHSPAALVTNESKGSGHFLAIRLRGVMSSRDAIGATIQVTCGSHQQTQQLIAGDGFQASNQRQLTFGLGPHAKVDRLAIRWPNGTTTEFLDVVADREILLIEGRSQPIVLPKN